MKTITIPDYKNPFVVVINNSVYQYRGGETIEVPDDVAEAIEDAIELIPKPKRYLSKFEQLTNGTLTKITASDLSGITSIASHAFYKTESLESIEIPDAVTAIEACALYGCGSLESVRFGHNSKLESMGVIVFEQCTNLSRVYLPPKPPTLENINAFNGINANCVFYCKSQESLDAYKAAPKWSTLTGTYPFVVEA